MNIISIKNVGLSIALAASVLSASAQKKYTEGTITYNVNLAGQDVEGKTYFKGDSSSFSYQAGPAKIEMISVKSDYFAILVDVPVASIKKAAVLNPGELEEAASNLPEYAFTATTETKKIGDYDCKKYIAKDTKTSTSYDLWMTTDISLPANMLSRAYTSLPGTPILFTYIYQAKPETITLKSINDAKVPTDAFTISKDFDKITLDELKAMGGGRH